MSTTPHEAGSSDAQSDETQADMISRVGSVVIDWPRSAGYFGGIAVAVSLGLIEPPLGVFIAAVPFFKLLNHPRASRPIKVATHFLDGMATPVGGGVKSTIWRETGPSRPGVMSEARQLADQFKARRHQQPANGAVAGRGAEGR